MSWACDFYKSTIGKKIVVALTGIVLFGFVLGHMAGNLKAFFGFDPESGLHKLDIYAHFLREIGHQLFGHGGLLWAARLVLLACFVVHIVTVLQLRAVNKGARPVPYAKPPNAASTLAAKSMFWGGLVILTFVIVHILHFTTGDLHFDGFVHGKVYANIHSAFQHWYVVFPYLFVMLILGFHLYHGAWSLFQTLGLDTPRTNAPLRLFAKLASIVIMLGFISVPLAIFSGYLPAPSDSVITLVKVSY